MPLVNLTSLDQALSQRSAPRSVTGKMSAPARNGSQLTLGEVSVFDAIDYTLDLSNPRGRNLLGAVGELSPADRQTFLTSLADLLQQGVIGTETLDVHGEPYTCFLPTRLSDPRLAHARPWRGPRLNLVA